MAGPHDVRHRPPAVDDRARRRDRRARGRRARRPRHARRAARALASSTARSSRRACPTRSSSPASRSSARWRGCERTALAPDDRRRRGAAAATTCAARDSRGDAAGRGRKLRGLLVLLRALPRRAIVAMFAALVLGTAASLAPAPLAKPAIDDGIIPGDTATLEPRRRRCSSSARSSSGRRPTRRPTSSAGSASARCRTCACRSSATCRRMPVGFYERRPAGVLISRMTNDVEALDSLVTDTS